MENKRDLKFSLILAGGGVRLAYHAGVLKALEEEGLVFKHVDGTSGGIFGTAMMASGISPTEAAKRWRELKLRGFMAMLPLKSYFSRHNLSAIGSASGIRKKIFPALGIDLKKINSLTAFDATFNVCNFSNKTIEAIHHTAVTEDHLIAGMSLPMFMPAVKINDSWFTDAVWIKDANLTEAINRGAEEIWLIWCIGNTQRFLNGTLNQYVHMIEMSASGGLFTEIELLRKTNKSRLEKGLQSIRLHIIKPKFPLPLDPDFLLNRIDADTLINMGYADAKQYLENKQAFDLDLAAEQTTKMKEPGITVHFRQQFQGKISLNMGDLYVQIKLSFFLREVNHQVSAELFSSISIDGQNFISGYRNQIMNTTKNLIQLSFIVIFNKREYRITVEFKLSNTVNFLIGLEGKIAIVYVYDDKKRSVPYLLHQPAINRLKNAFYLNTTSEAGWFIKRKAKLRILKAFFENNLIEF